jgi:hypothetical protein
MATFFNENLSKLFRDNKEIIDARQEAVRVAVNDIEDLETQLRLLNISACYESMTIGESHYTLTWTVWDERWCFLLKKEDNVIVEIHELPLKTYGEEIVRIVESFLPRMVKHMFEDNGIIKK